MVLGYFSYMVNSLRAQTKVVILSYMVCSNKYMVRFHWTKPYRVGLVVWQWVGLT